MRCDKGGMIFRKHGWNLHCDNTETHTLSLARSFPSKTIFRSSTVFDLCPAGFFPFLSFKVGIGKKKGIKDMALYQLTNVFTIVL
jgi:hypothetical protein